jgi:hypothetical protein
MTATIPQEDCCETCFGKRTLTIMKTARRRHPIDISPPPICPDCQGTGKKPKVD